VFSVILASALVLVSLVSAQSFTARASGPEFLAGRSVTSVVSGCVIRENFLNTDIIVDI
jgi:hypothetical protein